MQILPRFSRAVACGIAVLLGVCATAHAQAPFEVVHTFPASVPTAPYLVLQGSDGSLYGAAGRNASDPEVAFKLTPAGPATVHSFGVRGNLSGMIQGTDGQFYFSTFGRLVSLVGLFTGKVYRMTPSGEVTVLYDSGGPTLVSLLLQATDGNLYFGSIDNFQTVIYRRTPAGTLSTFRAFFGQTTLALVQGPDNALYGVNRSDSSVVLFRLALDTGAYTPLQTFAAAPLSSPVSLVAASDGNLYGIIGSVMFRASTTGTVTPLHTFDASAGDPPVSGLVQAPDGDFYGMAGSRLVRLTPDGTETTAYTFTDHEAVGRLSAGSGGIYGAFSASDSRPGGAVFSFVNGAYAIVQEFPREYPGGAFPRGGLVQAGDGALYGAAQGGAGALNSYGVIYKATPAGGFSVLHSFSGSEPDGTAPTDVSLAADGSVLGIGRGSFRAQLVSPAGNVTTLHVFNSGFPLDGSGQPNSPMVEGPDGAFYGTTLSGGAYRLTRSGDFSVLHAFPPGTLVAHRISAGLALANDGNFYGVYYDPSFTNPSPPVLYRMTLAGTVTPLHTFATAEGTQPVAPLIQGRDGHLYGVMFGATAFRATLDGTVTVLHAFAASEATPAGPLLQLTDGTLVGAAGASNGSIYAIAPDGAFRVLHAFTGGADGTGPSSAPLLLGIDGRIYGTSGGTGQPGATTGVIFRLPGDVPPTITSAPGGTLRAVEGQVLQLSASATSNTAVTVQWQISLNNGVTFTPIPGATALTYAFAATTALNGARYRAVFTSANGTAVTTAVTIIVRRADAPAVAADVDGDGQGDIVIWRPDGGTWFSLTSASGYSAAAATAAQFGSGDLGDVPFLADMDGDSIGDYVVWRASTGTWYWRTSSTGYNPANTRAIQWGNAALGDVPLVADLDGDGRADLIVWRPSIGMWFWLKSASEYDYGQQQQFQWGDGSYGDVPMAADLDADGIADLMVWRASTGTWHWVTSSTGYSIGAQQARQWGAAALGDVPLLRDLDGDRRPDLVVWRPSTGTWFWLPSAAGYEYGAAQSVQWGSGEAGDVPLLPDLDGDGRADLVVWRASTGTWYWLPSSSGYAYGTARSRMWGAPGSRDIPVSR